MFGSVVHSLLDQRVVDKIFRDHLNDHMFPDLLKKVNSDNQIVAPSKVSDHNGAVGATTHLPSASSHDTEADYRPADASHTLLLHSLPDGDINLNLELSSSMAIGTVYYI